MKLLRKRFLPYAHVVLLASFVIIGCSGKEDPNETLVVCGNHTCGELAMVTTDTSSKGFHYLDPALSPDGSQVLFSADWNALPSQDKEPEDEYFVNFRQLIVMPLRVGFQPRLDLEEQGAQLVRLIERSIPIGGGVQSLVGVVNYDKGDPIWENDLSVIFTMRIDQISGTRLFRADISDPDAALLLPLYLEPADDTSQPERQQHSAPRLSRDGRWLVFVRHGGYGDPNDLDSYEDVQLWALNMEDTRAPGYDPYAVQAFPLTNGYKRLEHPRFSPDGGKIVFSGGLDVAGTSEDGSEIFTIDFDTTGIGAGTMVLDNNLQRITYTRRAAGDPISGILNYDPCYSPDGSEIYFVSTRRAPATTVHARAIWRVPADGGQEPELYFFTRFDDSDPTILDDGTLLLSSMFGFPTSMLDRLEEEAYQRIKQENEEAHQEDPDANPLLTEVELRKRAAAERRDLENFEGVMAHIYLFGG
jgi:Tol biopolymer transport system component